MKKYLTTKRFSLKIARRKNFPRDRHRYFLNCGDSEYTCLPVPFHFHYFPRHLFFTFLFYFQLFLYFSYFFLSIVIFTYFFLLSFLCIACALFVPVPLSLSLSPGKYILFSIHRAVSCARRYFPAFSSPRHHSSF